MKTRVVNKPAIVSIVTAAVLLAAILYVVGPSVFADDDDDDNSTKTLIAVLEGGQEVPPIPPSPSSAIGVAYMTFNEGTDLLCYSISFTRLAGAEVSAHFHGPAPAGVNADVLFEITPAISPLGSPKTGCVGPLSEQQQEFLENQLIYINVHSSPAFVGGEIRGQVLPIAGSDD